MKAQIDRSLRGKDAGRRNVKLGRGGIREVEFLVQALQLLYGGDDPWLRERNSLRAIFRLTERGYLPPALGRVLGDALRVSADGRAPPPDRARVPDPHAAGGAGARSVSSPAAWASRSRPRAAARRFVAEHRRVTTLRAPGLPRVLRRAARGRRGAASRIPSYTALKATGFADPDRARQNLRLVLEGRPLVPYPAAAGRALARALPGAARRALAEPGSRRGAQPVRALRLGGGSAHRLSRAPRRPARAARQPGAPLRPRASC